MPDHFAVSYIDIISVVIAGIALFASLYALWEATRSKRTSLIEVSTIDVAYDKAIFTFLLCVSNGSSLPVSVNDAEFFFLDKKYIVDTELNPGLFPLNIPSYQSSVLKVSFKCKDTSDFDTVCCHKVILHTSRGVLHRSFSFYRFR